MKHAIVRSWIGASLLVLATVSASAEDVTVNAILSAHAAGASADNLVAMVGNPANTLAVASPEDFATLRAGGVPETVLTAIGARVAATAAAPTLVEPDDPRLVNIVRLIKSGTSESIIAEQVRQTGRPFNLSVTDLLYLKQNGVLESTISVLMATGAGTPPAPGTVAPRVGAAVPAAPHELAFDDLVLVRPAFLKKSRPGRLVMQGESLAWVDGDDPKKNFEFQISGLEKVWLTCQARTHENFCYQINFQIVKGAKYRFLDLNKESGSNASVIKVMDALHLYFPDAAFGPPDA